MKERGRRGAARWCAGESPPSGTALQQQYVSEQQVLELADDRAASATCAVTRRLNLKKQPVDIWRKNGHEKRRWRALHDRRGIKIMTAATTSTE